MKDLNLLLIQSSLHWEQPDANLRMFTEKLASAQSETDIIVLPEMFSTGFSMNTALAEEMDGKSLAWMRREANKKGCVITGSLMIKDGDSCFNRLIWMRPDGSFETYDKRHLFRMMEEDKYFTAGKKRVVIEHGGWRICPLICYDMRFPVWSRNCNDCDLLLYVANWPEVRRTAWNDLVKGRAHENQCYVVALNRIGTDGRGIPFTGDSAAVGPRGELLWQATPGKEEAGVISLSWDELENYRKKFPQHLDADDFTIDLN